MRHVAILQARMGAQRLPGKVLQDIAGVTMLARTVERTRRSSLLDEVVVATTLHPQDDAVVGECARIGVPCFRGAERDVLDRYARAAEMFAAGSVIRITCDCPLIDPEVIDRVLMAFLQEQPDFASNTLKRTYPRGLDVEVIGRSTLDCASREARVPHEREHVTPYIFEHPDRFRLLSVVGEEDLSAYRLTVDTEEDLRLVRSLYERLGANGHFTWREIIALLRAEPSLAALNRSVIQKSHCEHERR